jgi:hypothetical protein
MFAVRTPRIRERILECLYQVVAVRKRLDMVVRYRHAIQHSSIASTVRLDYAPDGMGAVIAAHRRFPVGLP